MRVDHRDDYNLFRYLSDDLVFSLVLLSLHIVVFG